MTEEKNKEFREKLLALLTEYGVELQTSIDTRIIVVDKKKEETV